MLFDIGDMAVVEEVLPTLEDPHDLYERVIYPLKC